MAIVLIPALKAKKGKTASARMKPPRFYYFKSWHARISLEEAQREPLDQRLFA